MLPAFLPNHGKSAFAQSDRRPKMRTDYLYIVGLRVLTRLEVLYSPKPERTRNERLSSSSGSRD